MTHEPQFAYAGQREPSLSEMGLAATSLFYLGRAVGGEVFLLTSPFIERLQRGNPQPGGMRG